MLMFIEEDPEEMYTFLKDYAYVLTHTPVPPAGNIAVVGFSVTYILFVCFVALHLKSTAMQQLWSWRDSQFT